MLRAMKWTLRQRRYQALAVIMALLAIGCTGAGTFELHRYHEKQRGNAALRANAHAPTSPLTTTMVPLTGQGAAPGDAVKFCSVSISGTYEPAAQTYVGNHTQGGHQGFYVLTPFRTSAGTLLVARGFVAATSTEQRPASVAAPPSGPVRLVGRLYPTQTDDDKLGVLGHGEITSINPAQQAARLGSPVYQAYLALDAGRPGVTGLDALPRPDLSNPTGGAGSVQLLSYVVQWYVFALLALVAPFLFARSDAREAQKLFLGVDPDAGQFDLPDAAHPSRPRLAAGTSAESGALVRRGGSALARSEGQASPRMEHARRLADRYGRNLGPDPVDPFAGDEREVGRLPRGEPVRRTNASAPHRSADDYHGSYNDYLWQLALADGEAPDVDVRRADVNGDPVPRPIDGVRVYGPAEARTVTEADHDADRDR